VIEELQEIEGIVEMANQTIKVKVVLITRMQLFKKNMKIIKF
jgi:hypothetical protein